MKPLAAAQQAEGYRVVLVDIEDVYDEYSFGHTDPWAIRNFLRDASERWQREPRFVLLVGDASLDPRNYLGFGNFDFVPTRILATQYLEAATDEWFVDFDEDGIGEMAVGRLPVRSRDQARQLVAKIVAYRQSDAGRLRQALLVADENDGFNFEWATEQIQAELPNGIAVRKILRGRMGG